MAQSRSMARLVFGQTWGILGGALAAVGVIFAVVGLFVPSVGPQFLAAGGGLVVAGALALLPARQDARRLQWLATHGEAVEGEVTGYRMTYVRIRTATQYRLLYAFTDRTGTRREGAGALRPPEEIMTLPKGSKVRVLVDPENPASFALENDVREA